ncbi:hypothetical protein Metlim_2291 [Methanoplanus limicola DSM 2279]|uniref:Thioredoxin domain-containing protein n=1 Tax=Methanoplanus limicola DSM 2279 TaxID=937775 RepID=H1Z202_9EURY|nr:hypothetical protein Metlim_2291 [Methanoplanus limicola DSM 2279]
MNKKLLLLVLSVFLTGIILSAGCMGASSDGNEDKISQFEDKYGAQKVELYHFHTNNQCYSCVLLGELANETVHTFYQDSLDSGKLVFDHINIDDENNSQVVNKYEAAGSSLIIGVYGKNGEFYKENLAGALYRINSPNSFADYMKTILSPLLGGSI